MTTLAARVRAHAQAGPDEVAMRHKELGIWHETSWAEYWDLATTVAHGLLALGVEPGDRVAIHAENRPEWLFTDIATVMVRGATVGLYPTNPAAEVHHILAHSGAKVLIAEDQEQLDKALEVAGECPALHYIVYLEPRGIQRHYQDDRLMSWKDLLALGTAHRAEHPEAVAARMADAQPDDVATLIYTSGTTGKPKGVMLTNANIDFAIRTAVEDHGLIGRPAGAGDLVLSYLPLCHVAERLFSTWFNAGAGVQVNFAESIATVQADLREVQPTILFSVPRIWEKMLATTTIKLAGAVALKRAYAKLWLAVANRIGATLVRTGGRHTAATRVTYAIGWVLFYRALRERLGMRRVRYAASGAAPISPSVLRFYMGIGVPMHEVYGMTENSAIATVNRPDRVLLGSVGEPHDGIELRIDPDTGEILTRHPGVFAGYWHDADATAQVLTSDGWLHTGDVGEWVPGPKAWRDRTPVFVKITDRLKDIIITAGGKNIAPSELENSLKSSPYIKEAIVIGDRRPFLCALIGIELDTVGEWAQRRRITYTTYRDLSEKPEVRELVNSIVEAVNAQLAQVEQIKQFRMLPKELDHDDGELTATQKVRRSAIEQAFAGLVAEIYGARK